MSEHTMSVEQSNTVPNGARGPLYVIGFCVLGLLYVYFPILHRMVNHWSAVDDYSHGFLVAPLALYFAYEKRWELEDAKIEGSWWGLVPCAAALLLLAIGRLGTELTTMRWAFVCTLIGLVLLVLGKEIFKILLFPLFFLFLMVPLPQSLVNTISFPLQLIAAKWAVLTLQQMGVPALVEGNIIHLARTELFVAEACSGLRSLMALITLGVVFAHFFRRGRIWQQLLIVGSTIPIAIVVNSFRVWISGLLAHHYGAEAAGGALHEFQGVITFTIAFALLMGEARLLELATKRFAPQAPASEEGDPA